MSSVASQVDSVTEQLATMLAATSVNDLPSEVLDSTHRATVDWIGSAVAGAIEAPARACQRIVEQFGQSSEATVFAAGRASAAGAAFANGVAAHMLELDDIHKGSTVHAAAPIISAALAVAEREHATGPQFVRAVALGYEAALRIGEAVNPSHYRYWHPTGTVATFGAATAAGALVDLSPGQMRDALGSAGTQAAGLWEFNADGAMSKHLHPGKAAFNGIIAADLARLGFTGASRILEGARGFFRATTDSYDTSRIVDGLGEQWKITENCYKLYSCCGHTHSAIDIALDLRAEAGWSGRQAAEDIESIAIETYGPGFEIVKNGDPRTPYQAKFSLAYVVGVALLEGRVTLDQFASERFDDEGIRDSALRALLRRTTVTVRDDLTAKYPGAWPARVTITRPGGAILNGASDYPRGNPENPVDTSLLERKMTDLVASRFGPTVAERLVNAVRGIPACSDMATLLRDIVPVAPSHK